MNKGDRVSYQGRVGTVEGFMPNGMVDVRFDDASHRVERKKDTLLSPLARSNPRPGRRKRRRRARRNQPDFITIQVAGSPQRIPKAEVLRWRDMTIASARQELSRATRRPGQARKAQFQQALIDSLEEASLESLAGRYYAVRMEKERIRAERAGRRQDDLEFDPETGQWVYKDWTKIRDPEIRRRKQEEAAQGVKDRHLNYLLRERSEGTLRPLSEEEQFELEFLMQKVPPPSTALGGEAAPTADLARAAVWMKVLEGRIAESMQEAEKERGSGFPGYTAEHGYREGEGTDRQLLNELRRKWKDVPQPEADEAVKIFKEGLILEEELYNQLVDLAGQGKMPLRYAEALHKKAVSDSKPKATSSPAEISPEERRKLEKAERDQQRAVAAQARREAEAAYQRSATFRPKSQRELEQGVNEVIGRVRGAFFTRSDPPRLSNDSRVYCGNPIDGTAYYLVVDNNKKWIAPFVKWTDVEEEPARQGVELPGRVTIGPFAAAKSDLREVVEDKVVPAVGQMYRIAGLDSLEQEIQAKQAEYQRAQQQFGHLATRKKAPAQVVAVEKQLDKLKERRSRLTKKNQDTINIFMDQAVVRVQRKIGAKGFTGTFEKMKIGETSGPSIPTGSLVQITIPTADRLSVLNEVFRTYRDNMEHRPGVSVLPYTARHRSYMRQRKGKHVSTRETQPRAELIGKQPKAGAVGQEPDSLAYAEVDDQGRVTRYRLSQWKSPGPEKLRAFQPYRYRTVKTRLTGRLMDILAASDLGFSPEVAAMFIKSGAVSVAPDGGSSMIVTDPTFELEAGEKSTKISVWLKDKSESPFFSWVPSTAPIQREQLEQRETSNLAKCLSAEEKQAQQKLQVFKRRVQQLNGAFATVRSLFERLAREPGALKMEREDPNPPMRFTLGGGKEPVPRPYYYSDVRRVLSRLATAYSNLYNWYGDLLDSMGTGDPVSKIVADVIRQAARPEASGGADFRFGDIKAAWESLPGSISLRQMARSKDSADVLGGDFYKDFLRDYRMFSVPKSPMTSEELFGLASLAAVGGGMPGQRVRSPDLGRIQQEQQKILQQAVADWQPESGPSSKNLAQSAVLWLEGHVASHPADDLLAFAWPSLDPVQRGEILALRAASLLPQPVRDKDGKITGQETGIGAVLEGKEIKRGSVGEKSLLLTWAAKNYAQGGIRMTGPRNRRSDDLWEKEGIYFGDPLNRLDVQEKKPKRDRYAPQEKQSTYALEAAKEAHGRAAIRRREQAPLKGVPYEEWSLTFYPANTFSADEIDQQLDNNWATGLVLSDVYPALLATGVDPQEAREEAVQLLFLANIYYQLNGYTLTGPLDPMNPCHRDAKTCPGLHTLQRMITFLGQEEARRLGGSVGLSRTGNYTVYKTYNPILFEATRLFWPGRKPYPGFSQLLSQPQILTGVDCTGRYGSAAVDVQKATVSSTDELQVQRKLQSLLAPGGGRADNPQNVALILRGPPRRGGQASAVEGVEEYQILGEEEEVIETILIGQDPLGQPAGHYTSFALLWPLGIQLPQAQQQAAGLVFDPIGYLDALKRDCLDPAINNILHVRSVGLPRPESPLRRKKGRGAATLGAARRGRKVIDPSKDPKPGSAEEHARTLLRQALVLASDEEDLFQESDEQIQELLLGRGVERKTIDAILRQRKKKEIEALSRFQSSPGHVLRRASYVESEGSGEDKQYKTFSRWTPQTLIQPPGFRHGVWHEGSPTGWWSQRGLPKFGRGGMTTRDEDGKSVEFWSPSAVRLAAFTDREEAIKALKVAIAVAGTEAIGENRNPDFDPDYADHLTQKLSNLESAKGPMKREVWIPAVENVYTVSPPATPVYDAGTIEMLAELQEAPRRPPADLPNVFGESYYGKKALSDQAARWHGEKAIRSSSAIARAESEADQLAEMIASVEEAIGVLEQRYPEKKKAKKNSRRSRRARRLRRR